MQNISDSVSFIAQVSICLSLRCLAYSLSYLIQKLCALFARKILKPCQQMDSIPMVSSTYVVEKTPRGQFLERDNKTNIIQRMEILWATILLP